MSAADRAVALAQANERLQYVLFACLLIAATIWCSRYALRYRARRIKQQAIKAEAARQVRANATYQCRQRIEFLKGVALYLPQETAPSGRTTTGLQREKAHLN